MNKMTTFYSPSSGDKLIEIIAEDDSIPSNGLYEIK